MTAPDFYLMVPFKFFRFVANCCAVAQFRNKGLTSIPPVSLLSHTRDFLLMLENNKLTSSALSVLTESAQSREFLYSLHLDGNSLGLLPSLRALSSLRTLSVSGCGLSLSGIDVLGELATLEWLDISRNSLGDLPESFRRLSNMRWLRADRCRFADIPDSVNFLTSLTCLSLKENMINDLPVGMCQLTSLRRLALDGCPLAKFPENLRSASVKDIMSYLNDLRGQEVHVYRSKIVIAGYQNVGKSTLMRALFPLKEQLILYYLGWPNAKVNCEISSDVLVCTFLESGQAPLRLRLEGASIVPSGALSFGVKQKGATFAYYLICSSTERRDYWVCAAQFHVRHTVTVGIEMDEVDIPSADLDVALLSAPFEPNENVPLRENIVPAGEQLHLALWDLGGHREFQDGHSVVLSTGAIFLVLWDMTFQRRDTALAELRHWLSTLQLSLTSDAIVYIIATMADKRNETEDVDTARRLANEAAVAVGLRLQYRAFSGVNVRNDRDSITQIRQQLLADLCCQPQLGRRVPRPYLEIERLVLLQRNRDLKLTSRATLSSAAAVTDELASRALQLLNEWSTVIFLGDRYPSLKELVVCDPEWLTKELLGKIAQHLKGKKESPIIEHAKLLEDLAWKKTFPNLNLDELTNLLYAVGLTFPVSQSQRSVTMIWLR